MHINWSQWWDYLYGNRVAIGGAFMLGITAATKTAPTIAPPWNVQVVYFWAYDWFHQLLNITNTRLNVTPTITPPETKEEVLSIPKA